MKIATEARAHLIKRLSEVLSQAEISGGGLIDWHTYEELGELDRIPSTKVQEELRWLISNWPISDFVLEELHRRTRDLSLEGASNVELISIPGFEDPTAVASSLVDGLDSLPRHHVLTVEMPPALGALLKTKEDSLCLGDGVYLIRASSLHETFTDPGLPPVVVGGISAATPLKPLWGASEFFLQIEFSGYATKTGVTEPMADAVEDAYSLLGSLLAHGVLRVSPLRASQSGTLDLRYSVHEVSVPRGIPVKVGTFASNTGLLRQAALGPTFLKSLGSENGLKEARGILRKIGQMLARKNGQRVHRNLLIGSKWFLDSKFGSDRLLGYVQAAVALETLLGDKTEGSLVGIGALLGNRCAYLIATSVEERASLLNSVKAIYVVRSTIVHSGQSRLTPAERTRFEELLSICARVIVCETKLLSIE